mmetsp:Transcript_2964/g.7266  ORF Transcript_2964/g.7266 Transcript_2964/m.7266 type:complete len:316 (-) Transcript_2964:740-1687(-)
MAAQPRHRRARAHVVHQRRLHVGARHNLLAVPAPADGPHAKAVGTLRVEVQRVVHLCDIGHTLHHTIPAAAQGDRMHGGGDGAVQQQPLVRGEARVGDGPSDAARAHVLAQRPVAAHVIHAHALVLVRGDEERAVPARELADVRAAVHVVHGAPGPRGQRAAVQVRALRPREPGHIPQPAVALGQQPGPAGQHQPAWSRLLLFLLLLVLMLPLPLAGTFGLALGPAAAVPAAPGACALLPLSTCLLLLLLRAARPRAQRGGRGRQQRPEQAAPALGRCGADRPRRLPCLAAPACLLAGPACCARIFARTGCLCLC